MSHTRQFRQLLRTTSKSMNGSAYHGGGEPTEATSLLPTTNGHAIGPPRRHDSILKHVFLDSESTPGTDSPNLFVKWPATIWNVTKITLLSSWVNWLLVFVPIGIIAGKQEWSAPAVFTLNFFAIIPLAAVLSFATEQISERLGDTLGGLVNATFGNAVELIVSIVALRAGEIEIVQASMLGSILSNLLLVLGMCFFLGGIYNLRDPQGLGWEQTFSSGTAQTTCSLMTLSAASMIIPAALFKFLDHDGSAKESVIILSRGTSVILLILYCMYLYFSLYTHKHLFEPEASTERHETKIFMGPWSAAAVLIVTTLIISVCADYMVDSIDALVATGKISKTFIGLILIPIVGNAAEHVTACVVAVKNKMDLAMSVAIGSSIQIALLVTPSLVMLGWAIGQPMTLHFETFATIAFALSVMVVTYTVQDGKSNYLEGAMLLGLYAIIALAFWASPTAQLDKVDGLVG